MITITDPAAVKLKELLETQEQPDLYLRLFIQPGGCEGFSYANALHGISMRARRKPAAASTWAVPGASGASTLKLIPSALTSVPAGTVSR